MKANTRISFACAPTRGPRTSAALSSPSRGSLGTITTNSLKACRVLPKPTWRCKLAAGKAGACLSRFERQGSAEPGAGGFATQVVAAAWAVEVKRRDDAYYDGKAQADDASTAMPKMRGELAGRPRPSVQKTS